MSLVLELYPLQEDGKLVLLDFGQCKALPLHRHRALARLIIALDGGDPLAVTLAMSGMGMDFSALGGGVADPVLIRTVAYIIFDTRYNKRTLITVGSPSHLELIPPSVGCALHRPLPEALINPLAENATIKKIPLRSAPEDLFSVGRTIMLLRGLCFSLGLDIQAARIWRPYAEAALKNPELAQLAELNQRYDLGLECMRENE